MKTLNRTTFNLLSNETTKKKALAEPTILDLKGQDRKLKESCLLLNITDMSDSDITSLLYTYESIQGAK